MPPEKGQKAFVVAAWIKRARRDVAQARHSLRANPPFTDSAAFHCQQAVEKALKGFLAWHDVPFKKTHSIAELGGQALKVDSSLESWVRKAIYLTPFATVFRYPGEPEVPTREEALEAIELAGMICAEVESRLQLPSAPDGLSGETPGPHPWRLCPLGQHWVRVHPRRTPVSETHPDGKTNVNGHCQRNPSHKDVIYPDELREISTNHFEGLKGPPCPDALGFENGNKYDSLIRGWTKYWNDVFQPKTPLDPDLVKALIATESGFRPGVTKFAGKKIGMARGLMQITDQSQRILKNTKGELRDHLVSVKQSEMKDPDSNIAAGIRWLFRKKEIADHRKGKDLPWVEIIADYKAYDPDDDQLKKFRGIYDTLSRCNNKKKA